MLGLEVETAEAIRALDEHWDGGGQPHGLRGDEIPLLGRILCLAQTVEIFHAAGGPARRGGGPKATRAVVRSRARRCARSGLRRRGVLGLVAERRRSSWEPEDRLLMADNARLDRIADAFAGVVDAKSPWTYRHSDRACVIVTGLASELGADVGMLRDLRRAALLHDVGKLAISNRILDKPTRLTEAEFAPDARASRGDRADPGAGPGLRAPGRAGERAPRAPRRGRLPARTAGIAADDAHATARDGRRVRGAHVAPPVPAGAGRSDDALAIMRTDVPARLDGEAFTALEGLLAEQGDEPRRPGEGRSVASRKRCSTPTAGRDPNPRSGEPRAAPASGGGDLLELRRGAEPPQAQRLEVAHVARAQAQPARGLRHRGRRLVPEPVAGLDHRPLARRQRRQHVPDGVGEQAPPRPGRRARRPRRRPAARPARWRRPRRPARAGRGRRGGARRRARPPRRATPASRRSSAGSGSRPSSAASRRSSRSSWRTRWPVWSGSRITRPLSLMARPTAWRIQMVA